LNLSPDLVLVVDRDLQLVAQNQAATAHAPQATEPADFFTSDSRDMYIATVKRVVANAAAGGFEWGESGVGGVRCWYSACVSPVELNGEVVGAITCSRDVTEMKRHEERLRRSEQLMVDT